jgi:hypothetical protein
MLPFGVTISATLPQGSDIPEGLMNNPVYIVAIVKELYPRSAFRMHPLE